MGTGSHITLDVDGSVATVTIDRQESRNALDSETWRQLRGRLDEIAASVAIRAVVLRGAGEHAFTAGADIAELKRVTRTATGSRAYVELVESVMSRLESLPQPVIAAVGGDAVGAGLELLAACDLRLARGGVRLGIPAARLGIAVTGQDLQRLERLVGVGRLKWLLLTARLIDVEVALEWGLMNAVYAAAELEREALALAREVAANSASTHRLTKEALRTYRDPVAQGEEAGFGCSLPAWSSPSLAEGIAAFLDRRPPDFQSVEGVAPVKPS